MRLEAAFSKKPCLVACACLLLPALVAAQTGVQWTGPNSGTLGGSILTASGFGTASILSYDLSTANYAAAPLGNPQPCIDSNANSNWTVALSPPLGGFAYHGKFVRGASGISSGLSIDYTVSQPFVILSGFSQASVTGNTRTVPSSSFHDGILLFTSPVASLSCTTTADQLSFQAGSMSWSVDVIDVDSIGGGDPITAGSTWNFQAWYRDVNPGQTSNFTEGVSIPFQ